MEQKIVLKKNEEHRLLSGHLWVFSNEISSVSGSPAAGDIVEIFRHDGGFVGIGFYHPHSLIAARILSRNRENIDSAYFDRRIRAAERLRRRLFPQSECFRLIHGESDFLPGLVIDKFNELISIQVFSAGMEKHLSVICDVLDERFHPKAIVARNDFPMRTLEQLPLYTSVLRGTAEPTIVVDEEVKYSIDVLIGQKTGFFLDQRENRLYVRRLAQGLSVLDCFCNEGGFALHASFGGAANVLGIDLSDSALAKARVNAEINQAKNVEFQEADVFDFLKSAHQRGDRYGMVILDPPSFTKSKKTVATALKGYRQINTSALQVIEHDGFLVTASCSHHIAKEDFLEMVSRSAQKAGRTVQLLSFTGASPDHPVLPMMPETEYLKFAVYRVS
jgi:23S rRNA (cytosine1962-C5)-methyltransferase